MAFIVRPDWISRDIKSIGMNHLSCSPLSVPALSKTTKLHLDPLPGLGPDPNVPRGSPTGADSDAPAAAPENEAEAAMRKALGLLGGSPRQRHQPERTEVPVTVLRREPGQDARANRTGSATAVPTSSRLQQAETALAHETAARAQAERTLAEAQAALHNLQTKIGHADLARNEAHAALEREGEVIASLRQELEALRADAEAARLRAVEAERRVADHEAVMAEERQARRSLEQLLQAAEAARDEAERRVRTLSEATSAPVAQASHVHEPMPAPAPKTSTSRKRRRPAAAHQPTLPQLEVEPEPEPVKWWLTSPKPASRR